MNLVIVLLYYFILIPSIILLAFLTSLYLYWKYNDDSVNHTYANDDGHRTIKPSTTSFNGNPSPSSSSSSSTSKFNDRIVMTKEIDKLLCKIVDKIVEYYVMTWYRPLIDSSLSSSVHDTNCPETKRQLVERLHTLLRNDIWILLSCFIDRLYNVNHIQFISQDLIQRVRKHFQNINHNHNQKEDNDNGTLISESRPNSIGHHRKNQHSISSIVTNISRSSSSSDVDDDNDISDISCSASQTTTDLISNLNDNDKTILVKSKLSSFISNSKTQKFLLNLNPFQKTSSMNPDVFQSSSQVNDNDNAEQQTKATIVEPIHSAPIFPTKVTIIYPLASHLADSNSEKFLIENLANFILTTLLNDINRGYQNQLSSPSSSESKLSLIQNSQTIRSFLNEIFAKILYDTIDLITQPKIINYQIVKILKQYFILKDLLFFDNNSIQKSSNTNNLKQSTNETDDSISCSDSYDDDDDDDGDGGGEYFGHKKNVFILNEAKQCILANDFERLYELIDQCNNIKLLKHIRLKLIAEILDAAVVSHLDRRNVAGLDDQGFPQRRQHSTVNTRQLSPDCVESFTFNGQINLKFKKFKQEKNIKRLITQLRFAKTLCEQKIQIRKRTLAELLPMTIDDNNHNNSSSSFVDVEIMNQDEESTSPSPVKVTKSKLIRRYSYDDLSFQSDLVRSISLDDSMIVPHKSYDDDNRSIGNHHHHHSDNQFQRPKQKKIFKFHQIMANKISRDYFKTFLQRSLLQTDPATTKRSSLMKFRKDVLLVDCTVYMLEFWENLQTVFQNFQHLNNSNDDDDDDDRQTTILYRSFEDSFKKIFAMITDQRFFYTFSRQFLSISTDLMLSLERFLLGNIEIEALNISIEHFDLYNNDDREMFLRNYNDLRGQDDMSSAFYVLKRIDWCQYLDVFVRLERILFDCFHQEFYPQFLISQEYDQMLTQYFQQRKSSSSIIDLDEKLSSEQWCSKNLSKSTNKNKLDRLKQALRMRPIGKILLTTPVVNNRTEKIEKKLIDLPKNRRMLFNSIEFPFSYLSTVKLLLIIRLRLKCWIRNIIMTDCSIQSSSNQIYHDLPVIISDDIDQLSRSINRLHRILTRAFCWLNADFSCVITDCRFRDDFAQILQSSTANTAESKIMAFVENLFVTQNQQQQQRKSSTTNQLNQGGSSNPNSNFLFQMNVTALLSRFQYHHHDDNQSRKLLPTIVRNDLMSNWSYQWSIELKLEQLQRFYAQSIRPFLRFILFLGRYNLRNYLSTVTDQLQHRQQDDGKILKLLSSSTAVIGDKNRIGTKLSNLELKVLETFLQRSNRILTEIRQLNRSMVIEIKQQHLFERKKLETKQLNSLKREKNKNTTTNSISFKKLLIRDETTSSDNNDLDIGQDAIEVFGDNGKVMINESVKLPTKIDNMIERTEKLLNILFQQITAQELVVKSIGFLHLIGYDEDSKSAACQPLSNDNDSNHHCLRCFLHDYLFDLNEDSGLNQFVQIYTFQMLFNNSDSDQPLSDEIWDQLIGHLVTHFEQSSTETIEKEMLESSHSNNNDLDMIINKQSLTSRLFFTQMRCLLMDKTSKECFDYCLNQLKMFDKNERTEQSFRCPNCQSTRKISLSSINNQQQQQPPTSSNNRKFRLFHSQLLEQGQDDQCSATVSSSQNLFDTVFNTGNINIFTNLFRQSSSRSSVMTNTDDVDILLNEEMISSNDEPPLLLMSLDETQLLEPFFQLLIEIFELKGNTVTRTLRRLLMFVTRLFFGSSKMSRPYKQFLESLFTEKNVFHLLSQIDLHLDKMLKNSRENSVRNQPSKNLKQKQQQKVNNNEASQIDGYLEELNHLLCSLENQPPTPTTPATPTMLMFDNEQEIDHSIINQSEQQRRPSSSTPNELFGFPSPSPSSSSSSDSLEALVNPSSSSAPANAEKGMEEKVKQQDSSSSSLVEDPDESIKERKLQILAKQLLFAAVPTIINHLLGQQNIDRGLNKCFDILQYQKLNKHLIYEFIEAFMLEYFPEFRKLSK
ncbi:sorting nexin 25 [Dermatophagoides pteronyssinus]|uniref:Sorting nexin 25 n=1 Tax=Dermatophagoides pteronyssinus TaxID=6956 RepID=A0ABQ8JUA0_DERPT|nr:sorting nexin 25 [Dermatophagoides pteronyssinus]